MATEPLARRRAPSAQILDLHGHPLSSRAQYDGATLTRRTTGWHTRASGPNTEIDGDLQRLRDRHRDLARNNPWVRRAISAIVINTVGDGIRAQWDDPVAQQLWTDWFESTAIDADGRLDGYGLQQMILRTTVEGGAALIRKRPRRLDDRAGLPLPLQIQLLEPDFIDHARTRLLEQGHITQGVQFDPFGRRTAYWLFPEHPGDPLGRAGLMAEPRPAAELSHIYRLERPGQVHGVPWGTGALLRARMLDDYQDAQLERQRLAACFMAWRRPGLDAPSIEGQDDYTFSDKIEPGIIEDLPPGWDMSFADPPQPANDAEFIKAALHAIAADYQIPYEILTGDLSEVNFSSARMGFSEFSRSVDTWRWQLIKPLALDPLVRWFREAAALLDIHIVQEQPLWTAPAKIMVDKTREIPALIKELRAGLISIPQAIRSLGHDPATTAHEQAEFIALLDELGLKSDSVPAHDARRG